jgi:AhpD family alkylhydroperoxidase
MSRLPTPATIEDAPEASRSLLTAVKKQLGVVPNLFRLVSNSPAALEGYLGMSGALAKGKLPPATRERIALAVAQINGCSYCLSAHTYLGKNAAKLDDAEIAATAPELRMIRRPPPPCASQPRSRRPVATSATRMSAPSRWPAMTMPR